MAGTTVQDVLNAKDWVKTGYAKGVPMGGDLPARKGNAPTFIVWAVKDPDDGNLDRIQIIKGWTKSGQIFEKVYDVAWSGDRKPDPATGKVPAVGNTVDVKNATYTNTIGAVELKKVWKDPEFDPTLHAFYYARVIQIPTPRWSTFDAKKLGVAPPTSVPSSIQERAWTSPIWYTPAKQDAREGNKQQGVTVTDLRRKGAMPLNNAQLNELLVGKSLWMRNTVTGGRYESVYQKDGHVLTAHVSKNAITETEVGQIAGRIFNPERQGRLVNWKYGFRSDFLQDGWHILCRAQRRVRLRQLPDHGHAARKPSCTPQWQGEGTRKGQLELTLPK